MSHSKEWTPKDDEIVEEEEDEDVSRYTDQKDAILFAIHVSPSMLAEHPDEDEDARKKTSAPSSAVRTALECAYSVLQSRIISNPNDLMGIILFGTEQARFAGGSFEHIYQVMDLDVPEAGAIRELKTLLEDEAAFDELMVPCDKSQVSIPNVLFAANQIFTTRAPNFQSRKLFLITDDDDPHAKDKPLKQSAITRARDLYDLGVQIDPFFMSNPGKKGKFDTTKFYDDIIYKTADDEDDDRPLPLTGRGTTKLKEMITSIRSKATPKRAQFSTTLEIGPGLSIGVKGYILFKKQEKGRSHYIWTSGEKAQIVQGSTTMTTAGEDGEDVILGPKAQFKKAYKFGGEQIVFSDEEMKAMRDFGPPTIRIIGFKPAAAVDFTHNVKPAQFLYPDEKDYIGSTRTFTALHNKLLESNRVAQVWAITRRNSSPAVCYLYPSEEIVDPASGRQLQPPGFFMIHRPFADDIRQNPEVPPNPAPSALTDRMRAIVKQLHMPKAYVPEKYENPSLQWHYRILQAIALEDEVPDTPVDRTLPNYKAINKHAGELVLEWGDQLQASAASVTVQVLPEKPKRGTKRVKGEGDDAAAAPPPKAKKVKETAGTDVRALWEKGQLAKCTVVVLKEFLAANGLSTSGKKADLLERCEEFFETK